jgi:pimeloyl-ACP methyl ester carboxylesterase
VIVPGCSTCGMSVDWLRSCYSSAWRLFRDSDTLTHGRYYFSMKGTPFYSGFTSLGSRDWDDKNWGVVQGLGEDRATERGYDTGGMPAILPITEPVETEGCITDGETYTNGVDAGTLINGFIPQCIAVPQPDSATFEAASDYQSCSIQLAYARIIEWMYDANTASIFDFLVGFLGASYTLRWHPPSSTLPSITTAVGPTSTLVWIDGTASFQQFALQSAYSLIGPVNVGGIGTSTFWYAASRAVTDAMTADGANPAGQFFLCGHSYGGVTALITAARLRMADPSRNIKWLTYGAPHIGDNALIAQVYATQGINLRNDTDIVTAIPPTLEWLWPVYLAIGATSLLVWPTWLKAPYGYMMDSDGNLTVDAEPILDYPTLYGFAQDVIADLPYPTVAAHRITEYYSRIYNRCSTAEWPLTPGDYAKITPTDYILMESGDYVLLEGGDMIYLEF